MCCFCRVRIVQIVCFCWDSIINLARWDCNRVIRWPMIIMNRHTKEDIDSVDICVAIYY